MIKGIDIESDELLKIIQEITNIKTDDAISFEIEKLSFSQLPAA